MHKLPDPERLADRRLGAPMGPVNHASKLRSMWSEYLKEISK